MKGKLPDSPRMRGDVDASASEQIAVAALDYLVADPERLARFLNTTGLDPSRIRAAAADPGFLPAVMDYVMSDERLLLEIAREAGLRPEAFAQAQARLSPEAGWEP